jgi:hypothetical protein
LEHNKYFKNQIQEIKIFNHNKSFKNKGQIVNILDLEDNRLKNQVHKNLYLEINKLEINKLEKKNTTPSVISQIKTHTKEDEKEYNNIIYYPSSTKE